MKSCKDCAHIGYRAIDDLVCLYYCEKDLQRGREWEFQKMNPKLAAACPEFEGFYQGGESE